MSKFDELSSPMGFDFDDFTKGCEIIYKARRAQTAIYGESGSVLASGWEGSVLASG